MTPRRALNKAESAAYLGLSTEAFDKNVNVKPLPFKNIRAILYDVRDLDDWLDQLKCRERQESISMKNQADGLSTGNIAGIDSTSALRMAMENVTRRKNASSNSSQKPRSHAGP
jgi:hypothetical protein